MGTDAPKTTPNAAGQEMFSLRDITELLIKKQGHHEGRFDLVIEFQMALGPVGPSPNEFMPGIMAGVNRIGIVKTESTIGQGIVDAAIVNPAPKRKKK